MTDRTLSAPQRAELIIRLLSTLFDRDWNEIDVILTSFNLDGLDLEDNPAFGVVHAQCRSSLQGADSMTLKQLADYLLGAEAVAPVVATHQPDVAEDLWGKGVVRIFLSHLAEERKFVGEVSDELKRIGLSSFVAHDDIDVSTEWQREIERALRTADVLVGLAHPDFTNSFWAQQEIGWALGREIPVLLIGLGEIPKGFPARHQSPMLNAQNSWLVASTIAVWLSRNTGWGEAVANALVHDLKQATSFLEGDAAAKRLNEIGKLSPSILDAIENAYLSNDQLYAGHIGAKIVEQILKKHSRRLPRELPFRGQQRS